MEPYTFYTYSHQGFIYLVFANKEVSLCVNFVVRDTAGNKLLKKYTTTIRAKVSLRKTKHSSNILSKIIQQKSKINNEPLQRQKTHRQALPTKRLAARTGTANVTKFRQSYLTRYESVSDAES